MQLSWPGLPTVFPPFFWGQTATMCQLPTRWHWLPLWAPQPMVAFSVYTWPTLPLCNETSQNDLDPSFPLKSWLVAAFQTQTTSKRAHTRESVKNVQLRVVSPHLPLVLASPVPGRHPPASPTLLLSYTNRRVVAGTLWQFGHGSER